MSSAIVENACVHDLLVDCGNSRIKWTWLEGRNMSPVEHIEHIKTGVPARMLKTWLKEAKPRRVVIANVCGENVARALSQWLQKNWQIEADFIVPRRKAFGVQNAYPIPQRLGSDRWASLVAARRIGKHPVCIVDCGSALTIDALNAEGQHRGGLIIPGLMMMMTAVSTQARDLNKRIVEEENDRPPSIELLAGDTLPALRGGALYAMIATIDRVVADVSQALGKDTVLLITGGDAPHLEGLLADNYRQEPNLVFKGLAEIARSR